MAWSSNPQEPQWVPRPGWWANPPEPTRAVSPEWFNPNHERHGDKSSVGTLAATARQIERVSGALGGDGAYTPSASSAKIPVLADFHNLDSSATGELYNGLSAWGWALRSASIQFSGNGFTMVTAEDHIDGLSALGFAKYQETPAAGVTPSIGTLIGSVFQKYTAAAQFGGGSILSGDAHPLGGLPDGLSASAFPESDAIGFEDSEGQLSGDSISQIYTNTYTLSGGGSLSATVVPQRNSAVTLSGSGSITAVGVPQMVRSTALSNTGVLGAGTTQSYTTNVSMSGTGSLGNSAFQKYDSPAFLTGPGILSGGAAQIYSVAAQFNASGTLIPNYYPGSTDGLWATAWSKYAAAETEDSVGTLGGSVYQIYSAPGTLASTGSLSATARMYQTTAQPANIAWDPGWETSGNSTAFAHGGTKSILVTGDHTYYLSAGTSFNGNGWTYMDCTEGQQFTIETWIYGNPANVQTDGGGGWGVGVWAEFHKSSDFSNSVTWQGDWRYATTALNGVWTKIAAVVTVPAGYDKFYAYSQISPLVLAGERYYFDDPVLRPSNLLQGGGTLSATVVPQRNAALTLTGTGALAGAGFSSYARTSALSGAGALTSGAYIYSFAVSAALGAVGALTATRTSQYYELRSAALSGGGSLSATAVPRFIADYVELADGGGDYENPAIPIGNWGSGGYSTEQAYTGTYSYKWTAGGNWSGPFLRQAATSPMWPGCRIDLRAKIKPHASNSTASGYVLIAARFWRNATYTDYIDSTWVTIPNSALSAGWNTLESLGIIAPANTMSVEMWVLSSSDTPASNIYYVDAVSVRIPPLLISDGALTATRTGQVTQYVSANFGGGGTLSATATPAFTPYTVENTDISNGAVPAGCTGCYVTLLGGGGGGGKGAGSSRQWPGGGGGGGGGVPRFFISVASLGSTYSLTRGAAVSQNTNGNASVFTSGSVTVTAGGGSKGVSSSSSNGAGGAGGTCSLSGVSTTTYSGAAGGAGGTTGTNGSSASGMGGGGGGGGGGVNFGNKGGTGGSGAGGGGAGGKGGGYGALTGVAGSSYGGGGGGSPTNAYNAGGGAVGWTKVEWV